MKRIIFNMNANTPWRRLLVIPIVAALFVLAGAAGPAFAASSACPNAKELEDFKVSSNVAADFSTDINKVTTYRFFSLLNENPVDGVPGLIKYCVYPSVAQQPSAINPQAKGANGADWVSSESKRNFSFVRPAGNSTNIPLDGKTTVMGTATWSEVPTAQTILLHINDPTVCNNLYGGDPGTCFVKPGADLLACDKGDTTLAYNAMPYGVVNCGPPSEAFEAQATNEFGDSVVIAGASRTLDTLEVVFNSYGCESGHWYNPLCQSTPGSTFTHPITAKIYDADDLTTPLAEVTVTQTIPYRPASSPTECGAIDPAMWWNPDRNGGAGGCQYSQVIVLAFPFPGDVQLPADGRVVWSVAFNTSHSGYSPLGDQSPCNFLAGGCGYDSLNVGTMSFTGAPYSGLDSNGDEVYWGGWRNAGKICYKPPWSPVCSEVPFGPESGWTGYRPLGAIITK